ncbi:MAG: FAD-binding oxidoreductase [Bacillota bacterium]
MVRRWNGWGEEEINLPLPAGALELLKQLLGPGTPPLDARLDDVLATLPPGRLPHHSLVVTDPEIRLRHSRGQSLPDWIELRSGRVGRVPDGVAFPVSSDEVRQLLGYAQKHGISVIPYGGGTSVVGHLTPVGDAPVLVLALSRMDRLLDLDEQSHLATFQAGVSGPRLEEQLAERGYTLGHYPQSFEYSTLGGWVATRSSGQQSLGYGRIERLFAGGRLETPCGTLFMPPLPASAAGPDLKELVLGSEGRCGVLTEVTVRVRRRPGREYFGGCLLPGLDAGIAAVQELVRQRLPLVMLRLSDPQETATTL